MTVHSHGRAAGGLTERLPTAVVVGLLAYVVILAACEGPPAADNSAAVSSPQSPVADTTSNWSYHESTDQMRGITTKYASTESLESFPNSLGADSTSTSLILHKDANRLDAEINNPNLQFTCNPFTDTYVSVKFDNGPVGRYECTDAKGDKYGVAYLVSGRRFIAKLKTAKKAVIEAEVFQRGDIQMSFNVAGLKF